MAKLTSRKATQKRGRRSTLPATISTGDRLLNELRSLIEAARDQAARAVNSALVGLYWQIGRRIRQDILQKQRAEYGQEIVSSLSAQLTAEYGRGFSRPNLFRMVKFAEAYPNEQIVSSLMRQLSWTHLIYLIPIEDPLQREFYSEMCRIEHWSVKTLQARINFPALRTDRDQ